MERIYIKTPLQNDDISKLTAGQLVYLSGTVYTARDAAHKKLVDLIRDGAAPPFDFDGQAIYYAGPCPAKPGKPIGPVGPTTSGRMDAYSPVLIETGLKVMIGKGLRSKEVQDCIVKHGGIYFAAIGGAGALMAKCVKSSEIVAFDELGTEAVRRLCVENMPLIVAIDSRGTSVISENAE